MLKLITLVFILALIQQTLSHGWLVVPVPRGFQGDTEASASQQGPCGNTNPGYNETITIAANDILDTDWTLGGGHDDGNGQRICRFSIAVTDTDQAAFDQNILLTGIPCTQGATSTASVPITVTPGTYYLQFHWFAGDGSNWYNCVKLNVTEGAAVLIYKSTYGTSVDTLIDAPQLGQGESVTAYHSIALGSTLIPDVYKHLLVKFNQTNLSGESNLTVSTALPKSYTVGTYKMVQNYVQTINLCNIPESIPQVYIGMFASSNYVGNITYTTQIYEGELNFNGRQEFEIHAQKGDVFYYRTSAYSEPTSSRRLVIQGRGGFAYTVGPVRDCKRDNDISTTQNYCIDLPTYQNKPQNPTMNYYGVYFDDIYDGKVMLQKGRCADYDGVSTLIVSLISLLVALLI